MEVLLIYRKWKCHKCTAEWISTKQIHVRNQQRPDKKTRLCQHCRNPHPFWQPSLPGDHSSHFHGHWGSVLPLFTQYGLFVSGFFHLFLLLWDSSMLFCVVSAHLFTRVFCCLCRSLSTVHGCLHSPQPGALWRIVLLSYTCLWRPSVCIFAECVLGGDLPGHRL